MPQVHRLANFGGAAVALAESIWHYTFFDFGEIQNHMTLSAFSPCSVGILQLGILYFQHQGFAPGVDVVVLLAH